MYAFSKLAVVTTFVLLTTFVVFAPSAATAQNLITNPGFEADLGAWTVSAGDEPSDPTEAGWVSDDVAGSPSSGAVQVTDRFASTHTNLFGLEQCVAVTAGERYDFGAWVQYPPGQERTGHFNVQLEWYATSDCSSSGFIDFERLRVEDPSDRWQLAQSLGHAAPAGAVAATLALVMRKNEAGGSFHGLYDDTRLCPEGTCALQLGSELSSPAFPDFRFKVTFESGIGAVAGALEPVCLDETVCVSGAVPGRVELQLRVIGPRPNDHLWFQGVRFTPSRVVIEARQLSTGVVREYVLEAVGRGERPTNLEDRTAFTP